MANEKCPKGAFLELKQFQGQSCLPSLKLRLILGFDLQNCFGF